ncbi:MAG TPA: c-type cytochrome [Ignavibacteria bacterium]|nr:c-type cytochrome [Ignavibacteria bacterium]
MKLDKFHIILICFVVVLLAYIIIKSNVLNVPKPGMVNDSLAAWVYPNIKRLDLNSDSGKMIKYGNEILMNTAKIVGPHAKNPSLKYAGNNLTCSNCHFRAGTEKNTLNLVGVVGRYPQYIARFNDTLDLVERVNNCFERSLNGRALPSDSYELKSIIAYLNFISQDIPAHVKVQYEGIPDIKPFTGTLDTAVGKQMYIRKCMTCHGSEGLGAPNNLDEHPDGYVYIIPPIAGPDSYNNGAGMHTLEKSAKFLYHEMPYNDRGSLTTEEAYQIANYMNSLSRPRYYKK